MQPRLGARKRTPIVGRDEKQSVFQHVLTLEFGDDPSDEVIEARHLVGVRSQILSRLEIVDEKSGQIKGYESSYDINGQIATTSVAIDEFQTVEGVIVPKKYSQRFDLGQMTAYANFNTKQILVNSTIGDDVFAMPK